MSIKSSKIKYTNNVFSKSYCNYVSDKMKKVEQLEYTKNMNDTMVYANIRYEKTRIIRSMYLVVNKYIKQLNIQKGEWLDLGSGTGLLADEIEKEFSNKKVSRIDFSKKMLQKNK